MCGAAQVASSNHELDQNPDRKFASPVWEISLRRYLGLLLLSVLIASPAWSAPESGASAWADEGEVKIRLISSASAVDAEGNLLVGLQFAMAPGWKVYWRTPGDAGFPPQIDWSPSTNLADSEILWPWPERFFEFGGLATHGYKENLVLPVRARAKNALEPLSLKAAVSYVACDEICIPFQASLELNLPAGPGSATEFAAIIDQFVDRIPTPPAAGGPTLETAEVIGSGADRQLRVVARSPEPFADLDMFVEAPRDIYVAPPEIEVGDRGHKAVFRMAAPEGRNSEPLAGALLTLTMVDGNRAVLQTLAPVPATDAMTAIPDLGAFAVILAIAFLGGLVLNLMPCVLPVLSLKVLGVISLGGADRARIASRFFAAATGILVSFLILAAATVALKTAGLSVGWGVQFQEPLFLVALVIILTLFAANLWGVFEIRLPAWAGGLGSGSGESADSLVGHFASGAFATLLATPCSAPFLGTAVGFALARGVIEIFAVFTALGLGMALPYLAVATFPALAGRLPRPGPWMLKLKRFLALLLGFTALWLLTVLAAQAGQLAALSEGLLMVVGVGALWLFSRSPRPTRAAAGLALAAVLVLAFALPDHIGRTPRPTVATDTIWQPFDLARIPEHIAAGRTVFVDVTADWCITCQVNKAAVLERGIVAQRLADDRIVPMRADWTSRDPEIADYLERFGRFGIPFNAVYGPALPRGYALPELLTESSVLAAFDRAGTAVARNMGR